MKTKEELNALKNEVEVLNQKLSTLTEEELEQVSGGLDPDVLRIRPVFEPPVLEPPVNDKTGGNK